jgi:hypothetical protein
MMRLRLFFALLTSLFLVGSSLALATNTAMAATSTARHQASTLVLDTKDHHKCPHDDGDKDDDHHSDDHGGDHDGGTDQHGASTLTANSVSSEGDGDQHGDGDGDDDDHGHYPPPDHCKFTSSSTTAAQGANITTSGSGYSKSCNAYIMLNGTKVATQKTNTQGVFSGTVTIPKTTKVGNYTLNGNDGCSSLELSVPFTVTKAKSSANFLGLPHTNFPNLPFTGYLFVPTAALGLLLLVGGGALVRSGRRRRIRPSRV